MTETQRESHRAVGLAVLGSLVFGCLALVAVLVRFRELGSADLGSYLIAGALAFGLSAVALSRRGR